MAATVGVMRRLASLNRGETNKINNKDFGWHTDIEGACAECAFAKGMGWFWDGSVNTFKRPDVGIIQVRHTQYPKGCLAFRVGDDEDDRFVLVTGTHPEYTIRGWLFGHEIMRDEWIYDDSGKQPKVWFAPQEHLRPIGRESWK